MSAPGSRVFLPVLFGCVALRCSLTTSACGARHLARGHSTSGHAGPKYPTCAGCELGAHHAGVEPPPPRPELTTDTEAPAVPRCSKCGEHPRATVRGGARATPAGQETWCGGCRERARTVAMLAARPRAVPTEGTCSKCHEHPVARRYKGTPAELLGLCSPCRKSARRAPRPARATCSKCHRRGVGPVHKGTRDAHRTWCGPCRGAARLREWRERNGVTIPREVSDVPCSRCHERPVGIVRGSTAPRDRSMCVPCRNDVRQGGPLALDAAPEAAERAPVQTFATVLTADAFEALFAVRTVASVAAPIDRRRVLVATDPCARGCGRAVGDFRTKDPELRECCYQCRAIVRAARRDGVAA